MLVSDDILRWISEEVFHEKNNLDLVVLQICPDTSQKCKKNIKEGRTILNICLGKKENVICKQDMVKPNRSTTNPNRGELFSMNSLI